MAKRLRTRNSKKKHGSAPASEEAAAVQPLPNNADISKQPEPETSGANSAPAESQAEPPAAPVTASAPEPAMAPETSSKKRKRTRKRKRAAPQAGPDPAEMEGLSDSARKALEYVQQYFRDKAQWKFMKQRQNWLLRHVLWSPALAEVGRSLADAPQTGLTDEMRATLPPALALPDDGAWVPDEYVSVSAVYIHSMMGLAKERTLELLRSAAEPVALPDAVPPPATADGAPSGPADEATGTETAPADQPAGPTPELVELLERYFTLRRERAAQLLEWIESCEEA